MLGEFVFVWKRFGALSAFELLLLLVMRANVGLQAGLAIECRVAKFANETVLAGVMEQVRTQLSRLDETFLAVLTDVWTGPRKINSLIPQFIQFNSI